MKDERIIKKENAKKSTSGITLIALIVTIIVLLLLAGISISMLTGDNGILSKAVEAKNYSEIAAVKEELKLAATEATSSFFENSMKDATYTRSTPYINYEDNKLFEKNCKSGNVTVDSINDTIVEGKYTVKTTKKIYDYSIDLNSGDIEIFETYEGASAILYKQITANNYGEKIEYLANGITDWKIFYNDGKHIFIIASDYVKHTDDDGNVLIDFSNKGMKQLEKYRVYWEVVPSNLQNTKESEYFMTSEYNYLNNSNAKCISTLLNTNLWQDFVNSEYSAQYAIGGPTYDMFVASWNEHVDKTKFTEIEMLKGENGYYYNGNVNNGGQMKFSSGVFEGLYVLGYKYDPTWSETTVNGYWLASPFDSTTNILIPENESSGQSKRLANRVYSDSKKAGIRPVIMLKTDARGQFDNNKKIWIIDKHL